MSRPAHTIDNTLVHIYEREERGLVSFYLTYTLNGKRHKERIKDLPRIARTDSHFNDYRARAQAFQWARTEEIRRNALNLSAVSNIPLSDWFCVVSDRVRARQRADVSRHSWAVVIRHTGEIVEAYRHTTVQEVSVAFLRAFTVWLTHTYTNAQGRHLAQTTAAKRLTAFSYVMKQAVRDGIIATNPFDLLERGERLRPADTDRDYLTADELQRLIDTPTPYAATRNVYLFMCYCGLRISDVIRLRWSDIQSAGGRSWLRIRQQKTQNTLSLPLSVSAWHYLPPREDKPPESLVFTSLPCEQVLNRELKKWAKSAGINKRLTLHTARHTFATLLLTKGADVYTVSKLLGHSSVATTQIYAKIVDKKKEQAVDLLDTLD